MATCYVLLLLFVLHPDVKTSVSAQKTNTTIPWKTLSGAAPLVIARGGFSGLFPDSSSVAYQYATITTLPNSVLWCDVQLTRDAIGICLPNLLLDNITSIQGPGTRVYTVDGVPTSGHFSVDYTLKDLRTPDVFVIQDRPYRSSRFDGWPILTIDDVVKLSTHTGAGLWLNIQHNIFFMQQNLSMRSYVLSASKRVNVDYISSPEVEFLRGISAIFKGSKTKLIFRFLEPSMIEPFTKLTYGSLLKNLTFVKEFCSGIMVPKNYIWNVSNQDYAPISKDKANTPSPTITSPRNTSYDVSQYLLNHNSLVADAHREGLEVYSSDFSNDIPFSFNYSYDPVDEILNFIDKYGFSVDGVLSDFPITPSQAIGCFSHISPNDSIQEMPAIMTHNGASGVYPDSTDLAYLQAVADGADYIDCSVQMTSDEIPVCLSSIDILTFASIAQSPLRDLAMSIPEIQSNVGIFTFNLTWNDIQSLTPLISNPEREYNLTRNPAYTSAGTFITLIDFLTFAKSQPIVGIAIGIENAAYLATEKGMSVTDAVTDSLSKAGYNNKLMKQKVIIRSSSKATLMHFKEQSRYSRMYVVDKDISNANDPSINDIKSFAEYVAVSKESVFPTTNSYTTVVTDLVARLKSFNLSVYVYVFQNEFVTQAWDFYSDPIVEINSFVMMAKIDGIITEFPKTAATYRKNKCLSMGDNTPNYMLPVQPGGLLEIMSPESRPLIKDPYPILTDKDVAEEPLPPVSRQVPNHGGSPPVSSKTSKHTATCLMLCIFLSIMSSLLGFFL